MATASVSYTSECSICFETFTYPKILPCEHTYCLLCIKILIGDKTDTFPCPTCKQDVKIPEGGAKEFTTNYIAIDNQVKIQPEPTSTTQPKCPNHKQREVDYYCNNCNVGMCFKCILGQHKEHETLDIECDETRNEAIAKLRSSQKLIQNRIKDLKETRSSLLQSFEQLKSLCEDSCAKVIEKTEQIVSDLRKSCKHMIKDIRNNLEENRSKVEDREMEITSDINVLESNMESIISPSSETTLNILQTLPCLKEIEKQGESKEYYSLCLPYIQWVGKDFSLDIDQLGSVISKSFYIIGSYQFLFNVSDIEEDGTKYNNKNKFRNNNLVWNCAVERYNDHEDLGIYIELLPDENPRLNYCIINCQIGLLNINDVSKTLTITCSDKKFKTGGCWYQPITWYELIKKHNGYLNSNNQFAVQFDIKHIREISWK